MFVKYQHLERLGTDAVDGINLGITYVFPKLDGTNGQIWHDEDQAIGAGSRNRVLSVGNDNAGFLSSMLESEKHKELVKGFPELNFYGEWLVPHSLKTYREDAWRRFYIFDVYNRETQQWYEYDRYKELLDTYEVDYLAPISIHKNASVEDYLKALDKNIFLIEDGKGVGEGVVIKNYDWANRYNQIVWAKLITTAFKEIHHKEMGAPLVGSDLVEEKVVEAFVTQHLVDKVQAKIVNEVGGWSSPCIPRLLSTVFYDLITEEMWEIVKTYKQPRIDFKLLNGMTIKRIKTLRPDLF